MSSKWQWRRFLSRIRPAVGLDLGSASTRLSLNNKLVLHQPTCFIHHLASHTLVEVGENALKAEGKTPPGMKIEFPEKRGEISNLELPNLFFKAGWSQP